MPWHGPFAFLLLFSFAAAAAPARFVPGQILVKPHPRISDQRFKDVLALHGAKEHHAIHRLNIRVVNLPEDRAESVLAELRRDPDIEFAERDYIAAALFLPEDPCVLSGQEWHLARIEAPRAWDRSTGSAKVVVAVLDSGINARHPDLVGAVLPGYDFVGTDTDPADDLGHGTAVAGAIAAAGNNGLGVAGVAFGCSLLPVKVLDASGFGAYSTIVQGIRYAVDNGARIINLSIAGGTPSTALQDAINYAWDSNVVVVAAAGNNGNNVLLYPAACDHVVAVSATEPNDTLAPFSSYGSHIALSAPGDNIWTTQLDPQNPYGAWRGTSFACPIVAGVAALVVSAVPSLSNTQIVSVLEQTADDLGPVGADVWFGYGRVNAARAVATVTAASGDASAAAPGTPPTVNLASPVDAAQIPLGTTAVVSAVAAAGSESALVTKVEYYANGIFLAGSVTAPFAVNWQPTGVGDFRITAVAANSLGLSATSAPVTIHVYRADSIAPRISVTNAPANGARLGSPLVWLAGQAADNAGLARVEVQVNGNPFETADGTTNWSAPVMLVPGPNAVRVRSVDLAGNVSAATTRLFTWVVTAPLAVQTLGEGTLKMNWIGTLLEIGRTYTVRAQPGPGQIFAGWDGIPAQSPTLRFTMQSNLTLVARFVPNPFPAVKGNYGGLVLNPAEVTPGNSGSFTLAVTAAGAFSGKVRLGGAAYGFHGQFSASGAANIIVNRSPQNPLAVRLNLDLTNGTDQVSGQLTDGNWTSLATACRNVFNPLSNPAPQAGQHDFVLNNESPDHATAASGSSRIAASGRTAVQGALEDGRKFSVASALAKNGDCPFYLSLSQGSEVVIGWLNFPGTTACAAGGTALWIRTGTNAFAATLQATSAP